MALTKPREPGSAAEALAALCDQVEGGAKVVADFENISVFTLYKLLNPEEPGEVSYSRVARWTDHFKSTAAAEHLAKLCGGRFVPLPQAEASAGDLAVLCDLASKSADAISELAKARADGDLTKKEARSVGRELDELLGAILGAQALLAAVLVGEGK